MDFNDYDFYLDVNGKSKHFGKSDEQGYNENNVGLGITGEKADIGLVKLLTAGGYKNSFNKPSYYAGGGLAKRFGSGDYTMDIGGIAGGVTGYEKTISPLVAALLSLGKKDLAKLNIMYAPQTKNSPSLIMLNLGIPINTLR